MHPPLDRPHPDCGDEIQALKDCHNNSWKKFTGGCTDIKVIMDKCLKAEKKRLLDEMNQGLEKHKKDEQELIRKAFGKTETFEEYLAKDKKYQEEIRKKST